jgi:hypothetical protein
MTTIEKSRKPRDLVESIERGLDRMLTSPTQRMREMRQELEREENGRRQDFETTSREYLETATLVRRYLQSLPS